MSDPKTPSVTHKSTGGNTTVSIEKSLPESPVISLSALTGSQHIVIEFKDIDYVNSSGLRSFTKWLRDLETTYPDLIIRFKGVPPVIARQLIILKDYLPKKLEVSSMYVPFYCDGCSNEDHSTLVTDAEVKAASSYLDTLSKPVICKQCGAKMEHDIVPEKYLVLMSDRKNW